MNQSEHAYGVSRGGGTCVVPQFHTNMAPVSVSAALLCTILFLVIAVSQAQTEGNYSGYV